MRIALYEPDIPQNTGTILRPGACLGVEAHIIEPAGFPVTDRAFRRAGMDYLDQVDLIARTCSLAAFEDWRRAERPALGPAHHRRATAPISTTLPARRRAAVRPRESPACRRRCITAADARLRIPMRPGLRSLNVAMAAAMVAGEALRQTGGFAHA